MEERSLELDDDGKIRLRRTGEEAGEVSADDIVIDIRLEDGNMTAASDWAVVLEVKKQDIGDGELRLETNFGYGFNAYL